MTSSLPTHAAMLARQIALVQAQATNLVSQLCDRAAYAGDEEFAEIISLVRALRQFCGLAIASGEPAGGSENA